MNPFAPYYYRSHPQPPTLCKTRVLVLIRIVRMTFHPEAVGPFLEIFDASAPHIRAFEGCLHLELWQDTAYPNILTTYSHWHDAEDLEAYRTSELFRNTWSRTKPLFAAPPRAASQIQLRTARKTSPE